MHVMAVVRRATASVRRQGRSRVQRLALTRRGLQLGEGGLFFGRPIISLASDSKITVGDRYVFISASKRTALGVAHPVVLRTLSDEASISIGNDVGMSGGSICAVGEVTIGDGTMLGANVTVCDTDFHDLNRLDRRYAPIPKFRHSDAVHIGRNVFIGAGATILKGVSIGDHSIVGAGAVVTRDLPPYSLAAGNPARVIRTVPSAETAGIAAGNGVLLENEVEDA